MTSRGAGARGQLATLLDDAVGAVLVEPVQGRGGVRVPPPGFLAGLTQLCRARGALVIADEIFTGLGRAAARAGARWPTAPCPTCFASARRSAAGCR